MANFRKFMFALCGTTALAAAMPALAQEGAAAEEDTGGIQDIIVTAQKRSENAQDVPIAVSVFSGDGLCVQH